MDTPKAPTPNRIKISASVDHRIASELGRRASAERRPFSWVVEDVLAAGLGMVLAHDGQDATPAGAIPEPVGAGSVQ